MSPRENTAHDNKAPRPRDDAVHRRADRDDRTRPPIRTDGGAETDRIDVETRLLQWTKPTSFTLTGKSVAKYEGALVRIPDPLAEQFLDHRTGGWHEIDAADEQSAIENAPGSPSYIQPALVAQALGRDNDTAQAYMRALEGDPDDTDGRGRRRSLTDAATTDAPGVAGEGEQDPHDAAESDDPPESDSSDEGVDGEADAQADDTGEMAEGEAGEDTADVSDRLAVRLNDDDDESEDGDAEAESDASDASDDPTESDSGGDGPEADTDVDPEDVDPDEWPSMEVSREGDFDAEEALEAQWSSVKSSVLDGEYDDKLGALYESEEARERPRPSVLNALEQRGDELRDLDDGDGDGTDDNGNSE